jgi:hypothetical protein
MADPPNMVRNAAAGFTASSARSPITCLFTNTGIALKMSPTKIRTVPMMVKAKLASILTPYLKCVDKLNSVLNRKYLKFTQNLTNRKPQECWA